MSITNRDAVRDYMLKWYDLDDMRVVGKACGLSAKQMSRGKGKRTMKPWLAGQIANTVNPFAVRKTLEDLGYDVDDLLLDDMEPSDPNHIMDDGPDRDSNNDDDHEYESASSDADDESTLEEILQQVDSAAERAEANADASSEDSELKANAESKDGPADGGGGGDADFDADDLLNYFGRGQAEILQHMHQHHENKSGPVESFRVNDQSTDEIRFIEGKPPRQFAHVLNLATARKPILLVGPTGCGKTTISEMVGKALDLPFASASCTEGMSENQLTGWLLPVEDNGKFVYVPAQFVDKYENGGVFLLDEIDASDPNVLVVLHTAIANKFMFIPQRVGAQRIERHPNFVLIAAANTFGNGADMQFVGRNKLDEATLDRFRVGTVVMDYDPEVEEALIESDVLAWGRDMRERIEDANLLKSLSTRFMIDCADMYAMDSDLYGPDFWMHQLTVNWSRDEQSRIAA